MRRKRGSRCLLGPLTAEHKVVGPDAEWDLGGLGLSYQDALRWLYAFAPISEALQTSVALALKWGLETVVHVVSTRGRPAHVQ